MTYQHDGEDQASKIWREKNRRNSFFDSFCYQGTRREGAEERTQQKRIYRGAGKRNDFSRGEANAGGVLSQLIADIQKQIAGNEQIIQALQQNNESLRENIEFYKRLMEQVQQQE